MDDKTLELLIERARAHSRCEAEKSLDSPPVYSLFIRIWGTAYYLLGDKEAGVRLFEESIRALDEFAASPPEEDEKYAADKYPKGSGAYKLVLALKRLHREDVTYIDRIKQETSFIRDHIQERGLAGLDRQTIASLDSEDLLELLGPVNHYFQFMIDARKINKQEKIEGFHPNYLYYIAEKRPSNHRLFQQGLPQELVDKAKELKEAIRKRRCFNAEFFNDVLC